MNFDSSDERHIWQFLQLAVEGASRERLNQALEPMAKKLRAYLKEQCEKKGLPPSESEDYAHDILAMLLEHPPRKPECLERPIQALLAWAKKVITNKLINRKRQLARAPIVALNTDGSVAPDDDVDGAPGAKVLQLRSFEKPVDEQAAHREEARKYIDWVRQHYPTGSKLIAARLEDPDASWTELAARIEISQANAHQIRKRLGEQLVRFREASASRTTRTKS